MMSLCVSPGGSARAPRAGGLRRLLLGFALAVGVCVAEVVDSFIDGLGERLIDEASEGSWEP